MKNCKICNNEFENKSKGTEQLYCSSTCRAIAAKKRQEEKIINHAIQQKAKIEEKQTEQSSTIIGGGISKEAPKFYLIQNGKTIRLNFTEALLIAAAEKIISMSTSKQEYPIMHWS
jgi:endogenous inhibitor of DNA gyrase (YacG/DUF329 family)